jgi:TPR repeat protein
MCAVARRALTAVLLMLAALCVARAGPVEDADAAYARGDYAAALAFYKPLADDGVYGAQFVLGTMYQAGRGVPQNLVEAAKWYEKAAEQGFAIAQFNLAVMYAKGEGVRHDDGEAAKWIRRAAEQGHLYAQTVLGGYYASGTGVPQDYVEAHKWYNLAASGSTLASNRRNHDNAIEMRDLVAARMTPAQIAEAQKRAAEWKPRQEQPKP